MSFRQVDLGGRAVTTRSLGGSGQYEKHNGADVGISGRAHRVSFDSQSQQGGCSIADPCAPATVTPTRPYCLIGCGSGVVQEHLPDRGIAY
eukprot:CAMPEP_0201604818 /NCGR_PEP_ID=MMETSP0492-20130828/4841_1 /ASSEMBLY_ACC=CAM_ASM_000837 /TAXON_ID=420259 /ORGANISM="Thalassiosira gravida, Strain GMp14c1" /LENGTH=90 /DNA_ID=CAMNT_0048068933 /DNA_START=213 /DNA_END=482 /DNA_ORIENTATION=-